MGKNNKLKEIMFEIFRPTKFKIFISIVLFIILAIRDYRTFGINIRELVITLLFAYLGGATLGTIVEIRTKLKPKDIWRDQESNPWRYIIMSRHFGLIISIIVISSLFIALKLNTLIPIWIMLITTALVAVFYRIYYGNKLK